MALGDWVPDAMCADPAFRDMPGWFPKERWTPGQRAREVERVRKVCAVCPVNVECHEYANTLEFPAGVWAGRIYGRKG